jgi:hypothetical protein
LLAASSSLPGSRNEPDRLCFLFGLAPGGVCQARRVTSPAGALLPHRFTLTGGAANLQHFSVTVGGSSGGLLSVALSLTSRPVDVIHHPVLRCPDFPPTRFAANRRSPSPLRETLIIVNRRNLRRGCNPGDGIIESRYHLILGRSNGHIDHFYRSRC